MKRSAADGRRKGPPRCKTRERPGNWLARDPGGREPRHLSGGEDLGFRREENGEAGRGGKRRERRGAREHSPIAASREPGGRPMRLRVSEVTRSGPSAARAGRRRVPRGKYGDLPTAKELTEPRLSGTRLGLKNSDVPWQGKEPEVLGWGGRLASDRLRGSCGSFACGDLASFRISRAPSTLLILYVESAGRSQVLEILRCRQGVAQRGSPSL